MTTNRAPLPVLAINEHEAAAMLGMSIHWLRRDRQTKRIIPFYRIGGAIRYNPDRIREAIAKFEEGGSRKR